MSFDFPRGFNAQPILSGGDIQVRPLTEGDEDALAQAASDPSIWEGHPNKERYRRGIFAAYFDFLLQTKSGVIIIDTSTNEVIGCSAFYTDTNAPSRLSIGFTFLTRAHWGGATNYIVKRLMLNHIFKSTSEAWFHISLGNLRSQAATRKLGAVFMHEDAIDLGAGVHPWACYCLTREKWKATMASHLTKLHDE